MYKNPYLTCSREDLIRTAKDYIRSKDEGCRCEAFVPYASDLKNNLNCPGNIQLLNLAECLSIAEKDFTYALATRLIHSEEPRCTVLDMRTFQLPEPVEMCLLEASEPDLFNTEIGHSVLANANEIIIVLDGGEASDSTLPDAVQPHTAAARAQNCDRIVYRNIHGINRMPYEDIPSENQN